VAITFAEPREHRMLKNIEQLTRQKVEVARLPTVLDVRNKQLEVTRASIRETILAGDLDSFRVIVESLSDEYDIMEVATAAVKLAHLAEVGAVEEAEIEQPALQRERPGVSARSTSSGPRSREGAAPRKRSPGMSRIYIGSGRKDNMRPADLVGAIANEAQIEAKQIGSIEISDRFSLVELPEELVDSVIAALRATKIKGKRQTVRRDLATKRG
jgi:ATP-dependent RNA helicase DeaD